MSDREKKIAEIRKSCEEARKTKGSWVDGEDYADDVEFLLSELERKDEVIEEQKRELFYKSKEITELREKSWQDQQWFKQASANITEMQKELDREREENRKQFDRIVELTNCTKQITGNLTPAEFVAELIANQTEFRRTMDELQSAQQEIERLNALLTLAATDHEREASVNRTIIETLREELEQVKKERDAYYENVKYTEATFHGTIKYQSEIESLRAELAEKDRVLEWYADPYNHISFERDCGAKAKRVLTKYKEAETV